MKKLLGLLTVSLGILAGILGYVYFTDTDIPVNGVISKLSEESEIIEELIDKDLVLPEIIPTTTPSPTKQIVNSQDLTYDENSVLEQEVELNDESDAIGKQIDIEENTHSSMSYAYSKLNDSERELYDLLYSVIVNYEENVALPTKDKDMLDKVFNCVMLDHPEIFYVNGYTYTKHTLNDVVQMLTLTPSYCYGEGDKLELEKRIDVAADEILKNVYPPASDYDKIKYIYEVIIGMTEYDLNSPDNQNVISVLLNGRSVCQGYAKTFQLLLNRLNIPCSLVTGSVRNGERHAWNLVEADGEWYYVDVTWGDASYQNIDGDDVNYIPEVNYDYLLVPSSDIDKTHVSDSPVTMPYTQAMTDNYFVKEGLYITSYDPNQLKTIFDYRKSIGAANVALKCSDQVVYNQLCAELLGNRKIFDYLEVKKIRYEMNDSLNKLVFALN